MLLKLNIGDKFINGKVEYTVINYHKTLFSNVALLKRETYCPYVVAVDVKQYPDGKYSWAFGQYFNHLENAQKTYEEYIIKFN